MTEAEYIRHIKTRDSYIFTCLKTIERLEVRIAFLESTSSGFKPKKKRRPNPLGFKSIDGSKNTEDGPFAPANP